MTMNLGGMSWKMTFQNMGINVNEANHNPNVKNDRQVTRPARRLEKELSIAV
jgi:hypothetical protein